MVGLFVSIGVVMGLMAIVWLGASKYFEKGAIYVTYFNESVQGLQVDSTVKYRGVEVGRVETIRVAPDNTLIEVVMKINLKGKLDRDYVAQLKAAGITGIVFIDLDRKEPEKLDLSPKLTFASEHPIISSKPSDISQIVTSVQAILEDIKQIDARGISDQIKSTLTVLESTVANLNHVIGTVDETLSAGRLEDVFMEVKNALLKIQNLVSATQGEVQRFNLPEIGAHLETTTERIETLLTSGEIEKIIAEVNGTVMKLNQVVEGLNQRSIIITNNIKATSENLKRASESLEMLVERVYSSPSDLLFGQPPPPRRER
jgi:phospholipid/cholesterol/gamma-HCH transport system substrate-binding protein